MPEKRNRDAGESALPPEATKEAIDKNRVEKGSTPMIAAARKDSAEIVKILAEAGANPNLQTKDGMTALMFAAINGNVESVQSILKGSGKHETNINMQEEDGMTAMFLAVRADKPAVVEALVNAGADKNLAPKSGTTPQSLAEIMGHADCLKILSA